ncbi:MAG: STAS domain-containing protein [Ottowia sp.]
MLVLPAELTHKQAAACLLMLRQATHTAQEETVIADASALTQFDSSALAVLLECRRACLRERKGFAVHGMPARLAELAALYGVADLLPAPAAGQAPGQGQES